MRRPVILCEYAHAMGNSSGGLEDYWDMFYDENFPRVQGGFIWDFVDQGISLKDATGSAVGFRYGGDFGDNPNTRQFCCNGILGPDRVPHPIAFQAKALQCPIKIKLESQAEQNADLSTIFLVVQNMRSFTDTSDVVFKMKLCCDAPQMGNDKVIDFVTVIPPKSSKSFSLENIFYDFCKEPSLALDIGSRLCALLGISVSNLGFSTEIWLDVAILIAPGRGALFGMRDGEEMTRVTIKNPALSNIIHELRMKAATPASSLSLTTAAIVGRIDDDGSIFVEWKDGSIAKINRSCGRLSSWSSPDSVALITSPIDICLYRAPTDNDMGGAVLSYASRWMSAGLQAVQCVDVQLELIPSSDSVSIEVNVNCRLKPSAGALLTYSIPMNIKYQFLADGSIIIRYLISPCPKLPPFPRVGIRFAVPDSFDRANWFGLGPHEAYDDRKQCTRLDYFASSVQDLHVPYVVPQESGRRADPRYII